MNLIITALLLRAPQFTRDFDLDWESGPVNISQSAEDFGLEQRCLSTHNLGPQISLRLPWGIRRRHSVRSQRSELGSVRGARGR